MNNLRRRVLSSSGINIDPTTGRGMLGDYEVVDLGLPSGLLWATCNVGANSETEYGDYYGYGSGSQKFTYPDSLYDASNENPLQSSADTATQVMGSEWRMPTQTELQELIGNTNYSFVTINGVKGGKLTSKTNPNAHVFFPFAGEYNSNTGKFQSDGESGSIWSSTPDAN